MFYSRFEALSAYHFKNSRSICFSYVVLFEILGTLLIRTRATNKKLNQNLFNLTEDWKKGKGFMCKINA